MNKSTLRVAVFIDGNYFNKVNQYYRFSHPKKANFSIPGLVKFISEKVSSFEGVDKNYCHIVELHWFRGRFSTNQMEKKYPDESKRLNQMTIERRLNDLLMYNGIIQHVLPMQVNPDNNESEEKGIDVWLSLEAYELAMLKKYDVLVLIAGDNDYLPLVRKVSGLGTRVMLLGWEVNEIKPPIKTGQAVLDECTYKIIMNTLIDDKSNRNDKIIQDMFA